jgi:hypothetical protein
MFNWCISDVISTETIKNELGCSRNFRRLSGAGVTEVHSEKKFGSMQRCWSDRGAFRKGIWVNAEVLE